MPVRIVASSAYGQTSEYRACKDLGARSDEDTVSASEKSGQHCGVRCSSTQMSDSSQPEVG